MNEMTTPWWRSRTKLPIVVFSLVVGYFFVTEHRAHVIELLPWILILGCVGMHLFMHGGHGRGHGGKQHTPRQDNPGPPNEANGGQGR